MPLPIDHTYQTHFNEGQRRILVKAMESCSIANFSTSIGTGCCGYDTEYQEFVALLEMLREDLPKVEEEQPGITHGLCF